MQWFERLLGVSIESLDRILFESENPFPNLDFASYNYAMAKEHAIQVDSFLGFKCHEIESTLQKPAPNGSMPQEAWIGLDVQSFMTPYVEIRTALELLNLQAEDHLIDLGCGYGRMAHIIGRHYPGNYFIGYELVRERVFEARRVLEPFRYANVRIEAQDLTAAAPSAASHYFIYDYGSNLAIQKTLLDLQEIARCRSIQVVARGRASRMIIHRDHPWLSEVQTPRHFDTFSIYRS